MTLRLPQSSTYQHREGGRSLFMINPPSTHIWYSSNWIGISSFNFQIPNLESMNTIGVLVSWRDKSNYTLGPLCPWRSVQEMLSHLKRCNPRLDILPGLIVGGCVWSRVKSVLADFLTRSSHLGEHILAANGTKTPLIGIAHGGKLAERETSKEKQGQGIESRNHM